MLHTDCARLVFRIRGRDDAAVLSATEEDLDELIGFVTAEANHEPSRRLRQRLDAAFGALATAAQTQARRSSIAAAAWAAWAV